MGLKVLLSVHTKERGRSGREGIVMEAYNQEISASCTLHLSTSTLLKQVSLPYFALCLAPVTQVQGTCYSFTMRSPGAIVSLQKFVFSATREGAITFSVRLRSPLNLVLWLPRILSTSHHLMNIMFEYGVPGR